MDNFESLYWKRKGSGVSLGIDFKSIEKQGRTVVGFATLDNVDRAGDIVPIEASVKAFEAFRGNIRMQHDKTKPVGTLKGFEIDEYWDEKTQRYHKGIKVAVQISEGAEDVWKMVQDGTLSGFSIGAGIKKASRAWNDELKKSVQIIDEYFLTELSLVDSPMNELCNVVSIHKSIDGLTDVEKDFVSGSLLWCGFDRISKKGNGVEPCPQCGESMVILGAFNENADIPTQLNKVFEISEKGGHPQVAETIIEKDNDGEEVVSEVEEVAAAEAEVTPEVAEEVQVEETVELAEVAEEPIYEADEEEAVAEVDTENEDTSNTVEAAAPVLDESKIQEFLDQLRDAFLTEIAASKKGYDARVEVIEKRFEDLSNTLTEIKAGQDEVREKLAAFENEMKETEKRLDVVAGEPAVKKSLDSVHEKEIVTKSREDFLFKNVFSEGLGL